MTDAEEEMPEYLAKLSANKHPINEDNFGPDDQVWTGEDGSLDPDDVIEKEGREKSTALEMIVVALILGHTPSATEQEIQDRLKQAIKAIKGVSKSGRREQDDDYALLEISWRVHEAKFHAEGQTVQLRPIVKAVVDEYFEQIPARRNIEPQSYIEKLEDKFNVRKDWYLARATTDNDWGRFDSVKPIKAVLSALEALGIQVDASTVNAQRLRRNMRSTRDETPGS
ncbi:hypothetical protein [Aliiroseovarius marinus]|uniref:hypothetical protein n=1 Tax=Aliiroseovarius marinus TaxID=2500159 RepID=UPI00249594C1|nr:hypothetical protein [Aliiroseovarius marinus]